jgi:hypothetical protein
MKEMNDQFKDRAKKTALITALLFFTIAAPAQNDGPKDTVSSSNTEITSIDDSDEGEEEEGMDEPDYFLSRNLGNSLDSIQLRKAGDSSHQKMRSDEDFWYANAVFKKKEARETKRSRGFLNSKAFETLLWLCVIGGFIAVLIIYLSNNNARLFRSTKKIKGNEIDPDPETDDIFSINYQKEIEKAINTGNYRLGVRLLFLQLLRGLSDRNIIQYAQNKTNFDYLLQVQQASWYPLFFRLTRNYEYAWYGHFDIGQHQFDLIRNDFTALEKQIPSI